jgi:hypothetical protein
MQSGNIVREGLPKGQSSTHVFFARYSDVPLKQVQGVSVCKVAQQGYKAFSKGLLTLLRLCIKALQREISILGRCKQSKPSGPGQSLVRSLLAH